MKTNKKSPVYTHEGAKSTALPPKEVLRRLSLACMLWEDTFYVDGLKAVELIQAMCKRLSANDIIDVAVEAHSKGMLRHLPLKLLVESFQRPIQRPFEVPLPQIIEQLCNRPDQMTELLSLYWKDGKKPLKCALKRGLARAFKKFDAYQLAKYDRDTPIKLKDVMFLTHPKPVDKAQGEMWKKFIAKELPIPNTWETRLSSGEDKCKAFTELLREGKMGKLAIVRNLRNMQQAGIPKDLVAANLVDNKRPLLPFQYLAAAKECPHWEDIVDVAMINSAALMPKLAGTTVIFVDVSGSMDQPLSSKGKMTRMDAASGLAVLLKEVCENHAFFSFSEKVMTIPNRRGLALRDAIVSSQPHQGTYLGRALEGFLSSRNKSIPIDRYIVITDEQTADRLPDVPCDKKYILNVGTYQNGIQNKDGWVHIHGFSEHCVSFIGEVEKCHNNFLNNKDSEL